MSALELRDVTKVRVELTLEGGTVYEVELSGPNVIASLGIELDTVSQVAPSGMWMETHPTGGAEVQLTAHGKLVKSDRQP